MRAYREYLNPCFFSESNETKISDVESNKKTDADPARIPSPVHCTMYVIFPVNSVIWLIKADNKAGNFFH